MITIGALILMFYVFGKIALFAIKAAWGIGKIILTIVFLPLILLGMIFSGLFVFAVPLLIVVFFLSILGGVFE